MNKAPILSLLTGRRLLNIAPHHLAESMYFQACGALDWITHLGQQHNKLGEIAVLP